MISADGKDGEILQIWIKNSFTEKENERFGCRLKELLTCLHLGCFSGGGVAGKAVLSALWFHLYHDESEIRWPSLFNLLYILAHHTQVRYDSGIGIKFDIEP